jgi:hypothetical protein
MANTPKNDIPFDGPYVKKSSVTTDKGGAKHSGISRAKHLARMAADGKKYKSAKKMSEGYFKNQDILDKEREENPGMRSPRTPVSKKDLKGNQHQLDKNKNGKIDAHDFKLLRKEDVNHVDELNRSTLASYLTKASDARKHKDMSTAKVDKRYSGVAKAAKKLDKMNNEEVEQVDELSKTILQKYTQKAKAVSKNAKAYGSYNADPDDSDLSDKNWKKHEKLEKGIKRAKEKMSNEEVVPVNELKRSTLASYIKKAVREVSSKSKIAADFENMAKRSKKKPNKDAATSLSQRYKDEKRRRIQGVEKASDRLAK